MYGAILGDIIGSPYEFDRGDKSKEFELFNDQTAFTDDTAMTIAVAEALLDAGRDASLNEIRRAVVSSMQKWGRKYPDAGYGGRFIGWLYEEDPKPYGSYGNGSAMRVSPVGWLYGSLERTREVAGATADVTHDHPEGIKGAESVASVIYLARTGSSKEEIKEYVIREFGYDLSRTCDEIRPSYHHVESCQETVPEAMTAFFEGQDFEDVIRTAISLGGDCDTLTDIAGAMAEAFYGVPAILEAECNARLPEEMQEVISRFRQAVLGEGPWNAADAVDAKGASGAETDEPKEGQAKPRDPLAGGFLIENAIDDYYRKTNRKNLSYILYAISIVISQEGGFLITDKRVNSQDGRDWLVAFTSQAQQEKGQECETRIQAIHPFLQTVLDTEDVEGVVINPWEHPFFFTRDLIHVIMTPEEGAADNPADEPADKPADKPSGDGEN